MVLRQGLALSALGIAIGVVVAAAAAPLLSSLLFGVQPLDTATFFVVSILFASVSTIACLVPARRATNVDPVVALRCD
jgi:ABC-type antimicrobial peptide transport system permease subunit